MEPGVEECAWIYCLLSCGTLFEWLVSTLMDQIVAE